MTNTKFWLLFGALIVVTAALWTIGIYIAWHFIAKFW